MAYTKFGEYVRVLRIKHHEVMGDMAIMLETSVPFLSAVENGKKNVPIEWIEKIKGHYNLSSSEHEALLLAIDESKTQYKINAVSSGINQRRAALQFARSFDKMDDETALKVIELLSKQEASSENGLSD